VADAGNSYRPTQDAHQDVLGMAMAQLIVKQDQYDMLQQQLSYPPELRKLPAAMHVDIPGENEDEEDNEELEAAEEGNNGTTPDEPVRITRVQRNREARKRRERAATLLRLRELKHKRELEK
jgi:hypothetical protein